MLQDLEQAFWDEILAHPTDSTPVLIFADWLEERGDPRAELLRLHHRLITEDIAANDRQPMEDRLRELMASRLGQVSPIVTNSIGMPLTLIPAGILNIHLPKPLEYSDHWVWFNPQQILTTERPVLMGIYPVRQGEYEKIIHFNPSRYPILNHPHDRRHVAVHEYPVEGVSWSRAVSYCNQLSEREGLSPCYRLGKLNDSFGDFWYEQVELLNGNGYRLPTSEEWEFACRSGTTSDYYFGEKLTPRHANCEFDDDAPDRETTLVGSYPSNAFGLYDMHGNVWEWCWSDKGVYAHQHRVVDGVVTIETISEHPARGGSHLSDVNLAKSESFKWIAENRIDRYTVGFRIVRSL